MGQRSIAYLLSCLIVCQPFASWGAGPVQNVDRSTHPHKEQLLQTAQDFQNKNADPLAAQTQAWTESKENILPDLLGAAERLNDYAQKIEKKEGPEYLKDLLNRNQLIYADPILKTEVSYRLIDHVRVPRLILNNEAFLVIDETLLSRDSKHLEQYVSRLFFETRRSGLNVNLVLLNDGQSRLEHLKKPKPTEWRWWREYFVSKYKKPTLNDFTLAIFNGVILQGTLTMALSWMKQKYQGVEVSTAPALWTMAYSVLYGTFISTIRNWTVQTGTKATRILKSQALSAMYAYGLVLAVGSGDLSDRLATISIFTIQGLSMNVSIMANGLMNNFVKDFWNQIPRLRESTRANAGNYTFQSEWKNKIFGWRKASVEGQLLYLIPWSINVLSLMTMATTNWLHIPGTTISVPLFQLASIPIAMYWSKKYASRLATEAKKDPHRAMYAAEIQTTADEYQQAWKKSFGMKFREIPGNIQSAIRFTKNKAVDFKKKCALLLSSNKVP